MISAAADTATQTRKAMLRGADFILTAQMPAPQPAWAQQYNARMEPIGPEGLNYPRLPDAKALAPVEPYSTYTLLLGQKNT